MTTCLAESWTVCQTLDFKRLQRVWVRSPSKRYSTWGRRYAENVVDVDVGKQKAAQGRQGSFFEPLRADSLERQDYFEQIKTQSGSVPLPDDKELG